MARIAVEVGLDNIKGFLQNNGHDVVSLENGNTDDCECCVISGGDKNMMGIQGITTNSPVINAEGMTEEEIYKEVQERVR